MGHPSDNSGWLKKIILILNKTGKARRASERPRGGELSLILIRVPFSGLGNERDCSFLSWNGSIPL
jgi:hypothetical protein